MYKRQTYPGPMGAVLTPVLDGLAGSRDLPHACTMNGRCEEVCPVRIPLKTLLKAWRVRTWDEGLVEKPVRYGLRLWGFAARRPWLYHLGTRMALPVIRLFGRGGWIARMPLAGGWTGTRDLPKPAARSFMDQYHRQQKDQGK